jgi:hypothetical protein
MNEIVEVLPADQGVFGLKRQIAVFTVTALADRRQFLAANRVVGKRLTAEVQQEKRK